jgi:hypothetical protein
MRRQPRQDLGPAPDDDELEAEVVEIEPLVDLGVERPELARLAEDGRDRVDEDDIDRVEDEREDAAGQRPAQDR